MIKKLILFFFIISINVSFVIVINQNIIKNKLFGFTFAKDFANLLSPLYKKLEPSVVQIIANSDEINIGSGFIYNNDGYIITNNHVVNGSKDLFVTFMDGKSYIAKIIGQDPYSDLAVIKLDNSAISKEVLKPLTLANSSNIEVGQQIFTIGNPLGLSGSMTQGIVSQLDRPIIQSGIAFPLPGFIQIDITINNGNSGGPLFDLDGQVIGITTASATDEFTGINFALPSNTIQKIVPHLILEGGYKHPYTGIIATDIDPFLAQDKGLNDTTGALVSYITPGTSASYSGIRINDVIKEIDSFNIRKVEDILTYIDTKSVGDIVTVKVLRDNILRNINITLEERPPPVQIELV